MDGHTPEYNFTYSGIGVEGARHSKTQSYLPCMFSNKNHLRMHSSQHSENFRTRKTWYSKNCEPNQKQEKAENITDLRRKTELQT